MWIICRSTASSIVTSTKISVTLVEIRLYLA
jgi:hypothetical protein